MSKIKKLIALTLALAMVLSVSAFAGSYKADTYADADKINEDCQDAVELLYALDIMVGDGKNFNPESAVTRAEMAKMIYVILNYGDDDKAVTYTGAKFFDDVEAGYWAEGYINYCAATKLIAGRGDNKFDPTAPVTTAEAAKMLLTAIGYSAEARGYTGANWDKNALADASIIGLLDGYKSNVNTYAPRQWVAVMIENMLLDALTFDTMAPTFNGLLTSGYSKDLDTMGGKYYGLTEFTGYLYATDAAYIDRIVKTRDANDDPATYVDLQSSKSGDQAVPASGYVTFANGKDWNAEAANYLTIKTSQMSVYDLGQQFRVIYDKSDKSVYSIALTGKSEVGECMVKDLEGRNDHGNYDNDKDNDYIFTVGEYEGWFNYGSVKVAELASNGNFKNFSVDAKTVYNALGSAEFVRTDLVKGVDRDGNGSFDYIIYTAYDYAQVASVKNNKYHGDYIIVKKLLNGETLTYDGDTKLYLDEVIITDDEIAEDDYIKYTWNYDEGCYEMEVLVPEKATYDGKTSANVYTFGGEKYMASAKGDAAEKITGRKTVEWNIVTDDNLLVTAFKDSTAMSLDALNGKLALVIGVTEHYDSGRFYNDRFAIRVLTVEGGDEPIDLIYDVEATEAYKDQEKTNPYYAGEATVTWKEIGDWYLKDADQADLTKYALLGDEPAQLFILHTDSTTEEVWLEQLPEGTIANTKDDLKHAEDDSDRELDVEEGTIGAKDVVTENTFFVGSVNSAGTKVTYKVMTLDELGAATIGVKHSEFIYKDLAVDSIRGGYVLYKGANLNGEGATGYAWITSDIDVVGYYNDEYADLLLSDGTEVPYAAIVAADGTTLAKDELYAYEWDLDSECYVLTKIDWNANNSNLLKEKDFEGVASEIARISAKKVTWKLWNAPADASDDIYFFSENVKDYPIALRVDLYERDGANDILQDVVTKLYFVSAADLADGLVEIDTEEEGTIVVSVVNGATIVNTFTAKSNSGIITTEDAELLSIHVKIVENTKQVQAQ